MLPVNLIPACFACSQRKGLLYERNGEAAFVHTYSTTSHARDALSVRHGGNEISERRAGVSTLLSKGLGADGVKSYLAAQAASVSADRA